MFGSQKAYGGNSNHHQHKINNNYGNTSYYSSSSNEFWGNNNKSNRPLNYSHDSAPAVSADAIANDSLYGYNQTINSVDNKHINSTRDNLTKNEKYGLAPIVPIKKTTTWASIASQPAKSQPKSLKAKMAAGLTGTTSKHLPPTITMDAMSWDSKNGSLSVSSGNGANKTIPPTAGIATVAVIINPPSVLPPSSIVHPAPALSPDDLYSIDPNPNISSNNNPHNPPSAQVIRENSWSSNGNSSPVGSIANLDTSRQTPTTTMSTTHMSSIKQPNNNNNNNNNNTNNNNNNLGSMNEHHNGNHSQPNKYSNNQRNNDYLPKSMKDNHGQPTSYFNKNLVHQSSSPPPAARDHLDDDEPNAGNNTDDLSHLLLEKLCVENNYNPKEFDLIQKNLRNARFFIIKSYSEDDIHRSIKYSIWCSTEHGNKRLDNAFRQQEDKGPIYLFFSVNRSGHFCGVAQMMSNVDYNASSGVWSQDKWKGQFKVKWIYVKDVPNDELRHITLENNENKPVTNSRDTQEVPYEKGKQVIAIIHRYNHQTSIFDDFLHYEKKQEEELHRNMTGSVSPPPHVNNYYHTKMQSPNSHYHHGTMQLPPQQMREPNSMGPIYRGNNNYNNKPRSYNDRDGIGGNVGHRNDYRNEYSHPQPSQMSSSQRNNFRNNYGDGRHRNDYYRDQYSRGDPYYRDNNPGYNRSGDYYAPPPQRDYLPPPTNDYRGSGGGDYPREHTRNHDRIQSWRN